MNKMNSSFSNQNPESGQAITEYILLLAFVVSLWMAIIGRLGGLDLENKLTKPIKDDFRRAYQWGHPKAVGPGEQDGPKMHPRMTSSENFRIFINPRRVN